MTIKVVNEEGVEITAYTEQEIVDREAAKEASVKAEYEAKLLEKDNHLKTKLDEFMKGKNSQEQKDVERDAAIAEAKRIADEASSRATNAEERRQNAIKESFVYQIVGDNPELRAKIEESWNLINIEIKEDTDIKKRVDLAASMSGISNNSEAIFTYGGASMGGGMAPQVKESDKQKKQEEYDRFRSALGLDDFIGKKEEQK